MEKRFATIISYIAHPLFCPFLGLLVISNSGTYAADLDPRLSQFIYLSVFILTCLMPMAFLPLYTYTKIIKDLQISEFRERVIPLYITLAFFLIAYFMIRKLPVSQVYQRFLFSSCLSVLFVLAFTYFWKISAHMVGWGGLVGLISSLSIRFETDLMLFLILSILAAGIVAYSRLRLNAHKPLQVYTGFFVGYLTTLVVFLI
jgi:membrane-associated phospholipid phosphatase